MASTVIPLAPGHVDVYRTVMLHAYEHAADSFTSTPGERAREPRSWWLDRIAHPQGMMVAFGAFDGAELVGVVAIEYSGREKTRHKALIVGMYVMPAHRGRGLARALMQAAIAHAASRPGVTVIQLELTLGNTAAQHLYESLGFQAFGVEPMAVLTPGGYRSKVHMWRPCGAAAAASG